MPRLSDFINEHSGEILDAWEAFAKELPAKRPLDVSALRDHAQAMLGVIAKDLETPESDNERDRKSRGLSDDTGDGKKTAASEHGLGRAEHGFTAESTLAEFRALRASVIELWVKQQQAAGPSELEEMRRFNEAIDQAIAESIAEFTKEVEGARDRFLAVLGHDLRSPLGAILTSSRFLLEEGELSETQQRLIGSMEKSGERMAKLVDDLLDLALTRFGGSIPLRRESIDLGALVRDVATEVGTSSPESEIDVKTDATLSGEWDRTRLSQALSNLLTNAVEHGTRGKPVNVTVSGGADDTVCVAIENEGEAIPKDQVKGLFSPMKSSPGRRDRRHLGLGLYIVDKIVEAHGGRIDVQSSAATGTTFSITLPRHGNAEAKNYRTD